MKTITPDFRLDVLGESCPYPALSTLDALREMKSGEILEVVSDCPQSINNIPNDVKNHGHELLSMEQSGELLRFLIKKA